MKKTAVIGSGPAGLTAAIYLARANLNPTVYAGSIFGGQLMITTEVENFPGFPEGVQGPDLMEKMIKQAERFGARMVYKDVTKADLNNTPFKIWTGDEIDQFDGIILATGSTAKKLAIPKETELTGRGLSYCATCDGAFFKEKIIAVVGGGDSAMEEATFLTKFASKVYLIHRRETFRASQYMQQKAISNEKIVPVYNKEVAELIGDTKLSAIKLKDTITGEISKMDLDGLFVAIGHMPNTNFIKDQITLDNLGYIKVDNRTYTNLPGILSAGDVDDHRYMQAITAAAEGCKAAIDLEKYLSGINI